MRPLVPLLVLLLAVPYGLADGPMVVDGTVGPPLVPFVEMVMDRWIFDVVEGDVLVAHLTWSDPDASLALEVVPPQTSCTNDGCFTTLPAYASCETIDNALLGTERHVAVTATKDGLARVLVSSELAQDDVAYRLVLSVNGEAPEIDLYSDEAGTNPHRQHVCRLEGKL